MGGCASKPKGLKADLHTNAPEPAKEVSGETITKVEEQERKDGNEQDNRRPSLANFLQENEGNASSVDDKSETKNAQPEPVEDVEPKVEYATKESNTNLPEADKIETRTEETPIPVEVSFEIVKTEISTEFVPATETEKLEKSEGKKTNVKEEVLVVTTPKTVETGKPTEVAPAIDYVKTDKVKEKDTEAEKTELAPGGESVQIDEVEEKKTEAEKPEGTPAMESVKADIGELKKTEAEKPVEVAPIVLPEKHGGVVVANGSKEMEKVSIVDVRQEDVVSVSSAEKVLGKF